MRPILASLGPQVAVAGGEAAHRAAAVDLQQSLDRERHLTAVLRTIRSINQLIVRERDPVRLIEQACAQLLEGPGCVAAWIGLQDRDGRPARWAQCGFEEVASMFAHRFEQGEWPPCQSIAYRAEGFVACEQERTCATCPISGSHRGARAVSALRCGARTYGVLGVMLDLGMLVADEEKSLLDEIASDIAFALDRNETEAQRARAEEERRRSEELFRIVFDHAADAILLLEIMVDGIPIIRDANAAALRSLGYERDELIGQPISVIDVAADLLPVVAQRRETARAGGTGLFEAQHRCKDGSIRDFACSVAELQWGRNTLGISIERDVTEAKKLQQQRDEYNASLAQSDRLASMGMLAAGVAHEIKNALSYTLYNLQSLSEDIPRHSQRLTALRQRLGARPGRDSVREVLEACGESLEPGAWADMSERCRDALGGARKIKEIARGLGTFSRVEKDERVSVDLRYPIESALNIAFNEIKYRARIEKDFATTDPVLGSEGKLSQVFLNLFINAAHAIHEGDVENNRIRVRTWQEGSTVCAEVLDTGCGIPKEDLTRIFEPFFTTKAIGVGSGLGLGIACKIISGFGGVIDVKSELGKGTSFLIRLPAAASELSEEDCVAAATDTPPVKGRVLVVDDDADVRSALRRVCAGHEVVTADSGEGAKQILSNDLCFDVILCDMMMPAMSGMDLHRWAAGRDGALARRFVFVTGGAFSPDARRYLDQVENLRVEKPFDGTDLRKMVTERVRAARTERG